MYDYIKRNKKKTLMSLVFLLILVLIFYLKNCEIINIEEIRQFVESFGFLSYIIFILLYIVLALFSFSSAVLTTTAGVIFGIKIGFILVIISATIAGGIAFFIGRKFTSKFEKLNKIKKLKPFMKHIRKNAKKNGFLSILFIRLSFLPYIWISYLCGMVKELKYKDFLLATSITNILGSLLYLTLGYSITQNINYFIFSLLGLLLLFIIINYLNKKFSSKFN